MSSPSDNKTTTTPTPRGYTMGYSKATTASHASRTIHTDAAFVLPHIQPHHKVLDLGCGPGTITLGLAGLINPAQGGSVTGVDSGLAVLESARALAASASASSTTSSTNDNNNNNNNNNNNSEKQPLLLPEGAVTFLQADVLAGLPFPDETFDVVFTSQTLIHLAPAPDAPVAALREVRRVLKGGGGGLLAARDAASITWHPFGEELRRCYHDRLFSVIAGKGKEGRGGDDSSSSSSSSSTALCGAHMPRYLRLAGWDVDDDDGAKVRIGGGATVVSGVEGRRRLRDTLGGRLARGDAFREAWLRAGYTEEECDEARGLLDRWAEVEDAWYGVLQSEVLAWK